LDPNEPEVKRSTLATQSEESFPNYLEMDLLDQFSRNWFKVRKAVAVCLQFKRILRGKRNLQKLKAVSQWKMLPQVISLWT